jgi:hypothetical protein
MLPPTKNRNMARPLLLLIQHSVRNSGQHNMAKKEIKGTWIGKEEVDYGLLSHSPGGGGGEMVKEGDIVQICTHECKWKNDIC